MKMKVVMTLLSDALPGGGVASKGIVDREVACDARGLPLIPARRIKGILREAAEELVFLGMHNDDEVTELFGASGGAKAAPLRLSDGELENAASYRSFLDGPAQSSAKLKTLFAPVSVLENFSSLRAQTTIDETGTAADNTLRISRVLNKGQRFEFSVEFPDEFKGLMEDACAVVDSFGSSRNRGLGAVRLKLEPVSEAAAAQTANAAALDLPEQDVGVLCEMKVMASALSQLLTAGEVGDETESAGYIPGYAVLGAFAHLYLEKNGDASADDAEFDECFLSGSVKWGPLYPSDGQGGFFAPAPLSVHTYKDSEDRFNLVCGAPEPSKIFKGAGGAMWSVGTGFENFTTVAPKMNVEYHHQRAADRSFGKALENGGDGGVFFQYETLERGQYFCGKVVGTGSTLKKLAALLPGDGLVRLGRSKNTQYGECRVTLGSIVPCASEALPAVWPAGGRMVFRMLSDTVVANEYGYAKPEAELLRREFCRLLGLSAEGPQTLVIEERGAHIRKKELSGYLGVWNLPKAQQPALAAGVVLVLKNETGADIDMTQLPGQSAGERAAEGCGMFTFAAAPEPAQTARTFRVKPAALRADTAAPADTPEVRALLTGVFRAAFRKKLRAMALKEARDTNNVPASSAVSRFIDMVTHAGSFDELNGFFSKLSNDSEDKPAVKALKQLAKLLCLNEGAKAVDQSTFSKMCDELYAELGARDLPKGAPRPGTAIDYEDYRIYARGCLTELKYTNRTAGEGVNK